MFVFDCLYTFVYIYLNDENTLLFGELILICYLEIIGETIFFVEIDGNFLKPI